jgi:hypothetical protein
MHRQTMLALLQSRHVSEAIAILRYRGEWPL